MPNEELNFSAFLREKIRDAGLTMKKLSDSSGIAIKHLEGMLSGNLENLPSAPYFRGYLIKLGQILNFDPEPWWSQLKESGAIKSAHTTLPKNRFGKRSMPKLAWLGLLGVIVIIYFVFQLSHVLGKPQITMTYPIDNPAVSLLNEISISGRLQNGGTLYINGEQVSINNDGSWSKTVLLQEGMNPMNITAKKFLGGETDIMQQIIYEPQATTTVSTSTPNPYN